MYYGFPPYVSVAQRQIKAGKLVEKLRGKGKTVNPIAAFKGKMTATFWGKSWCANLESYADYVNRLERGRSYVRSGCVCHLDVKNGVVEALVNGTELYSVTVKIAPLAESRWRKVCAACAGEIGSLLELLQGKLSKNVMERVCDAVTGIFPSPKEITLDCSCPDWANMCKHVAAALYGIGRQLDTKPELLFVLRGVNATDLIASGLDFSQGERTETLRTDTLGALFGIDLDVDTHSLSTPITPAPRKATELKNKTKNGAKPSEKGTSKSAPPAENATQVAIKTPFDPGRPTSAAIRKLRSLAGLSPAAFAAELGISPVTLQRWEESRGVLTLRSASRHCLTVFQEALLRKLQ